MMVFMLLYLQTCRRWSKDVPHSSSTRYAQPCARESHPLSTHHDYPSQPESQGHKHQLPTLLASGSLSRISRVNRLLPRLARKSIDGRRSLHPHPLACWFRYAWFHTFPDHTLMSEPETGRRKRFLMMYFVRFTMPVLRWSAALVATINARLESKTCL